MGDVKVTYYGRSMFFVEDPRIKLVIGYRLI